MALSFMGEVLHHSRVPYDNFLLEITIECPDSASRSQRHFYPLILLEPRQLWDLSIGI